MSDIVVNTEIQVPTHVTLNYDVEVPFVTLVTQADWNENDSSKKGYIKHKPELATIATTGSYNDLTDTPTIPVVPTNVSSFTNDAGYITKNVDDLTNYTKTTDLAAVAMSGNYYHLINTPVIPAAQIQSDWSQTNTLAKDYIKNKPTVLSAFVNDAGFIDNTVNNLVNYPLSSSLAAVAISGSYNDLSDTPSSPTSNDFIPQTSHTTKLIGSTAIINNTNYPTLESTNSYGNFAIGNSYRYVLFKEYDTTLHSNGTAYVEGGGAACLNYLNNLRIDLLPKTGGAEFLLRKDTTSTPIFVFPTNDNASINLPKGLSIVAQQSAGSTMNFVSNGKIQIVNTSTGGIEIVKSAQSIKLQDSGILAITNESGRTDIVGTGGVKINGRNNAVNIEGGGGVAVSGPTFTYNTKTVATVDDIPSLTGYATETYVNSAVGTHNQSSTAHSDIRNELDTVKDIAEGANIAIVFDSYSDLVTFFNSESDSLKVGTNLYVKTLEVPDLWIASVESTSVSYTYTTDEDFLSHINNNGQIGYYKFSELETQKVDLSNYSTLADLGTKVSKSGDTMSGALTMSESIKINFPSNGYETYFLQKLGAHLSIGRTNGNSADLILARAFTTGISVRSLYITTGSATEDNQVLKRSDGDARWLQIAPPVSSTTTLVSGALNELGTIDFSTISLPSTPGTAEYNCRFTDNSASGGDITQNAGLSSVTKWVGDTTIVTGKSYEMSIQNGWGIITQFD